MLFFSNIISIRREGIIDTHTPQTKEKKNGKKNPDRHTQQLEWWQAHFFFHIIFLRLYFVLNNYAKSSGCRPFIETNVAVRTMTFVYLTASYFLRKKKEQKEIFFIF